MATMCDTPRPPGPTVLRPRWSLLYAAAFSPLAALAVVEVATPPNAIRTLLRVVFAISAFPGMAGWVRASGTAIDVLHWGGGAGARQSDSHGRARVVWVCRRPRVGAGNRVAIRAPIERGRRPRRADMDR